MATIEDFQKLDIRAGQIQDVQDFPEARNPAFKVWVDFGELGVKTSSAQITAQYEKEQLIGRQVIAVVNFPPMKVASFKTDILFLYQLL
jgi:tRNA-binding protein